MLPGLTGLLLQEQPGATFVKIAEEPDPSLAWVILSTFALIGILLAVTVGIGAGVGLLRIWLSRRFPHNHFNGTLDEPTIRLHLNEEPGD